MEEFDENSWSTEELYNHLVEIGVIDSDVEPYRFWKHQRDDMVRFLKDVEQIWTR